MAKPADVTALDKFVTWRGAFNALKALVPEVVTHATDDPTAADDSYEVLTFWVNLGDDKIWALAHTTGSADAVWLDLGPTDGVILVDGTTPLTSDWDVGSFQIRAETFHADAATGTAPFTVSSVTVVTNLNADMVDGQHAAALLARGNHTGTQLLSTISDAGTLAALSSVANSNMANMSAWTLKLRNSASAGVPQDVTVAALTEETDPASGDWILGARAEGELRKYDFASFVGPSKELTPAPTTDHQVSGLTAQMEVGEAVVFGQVLYLHSDGKLWEAEAGNVNERVFAMAAESIAADGTGTVLLQGFARDDSWAWTPGAVLYNSTSVGDMSATAPSVAGQRVQICATATHADRVYFNPSPDWIVVK